MLVNALLCLACLWLSSAPSCRIWGVMRYLVLLKARKANMLIRIPQAAWVRKVILQWNTIFWYWKSTSWSNFSLLLVERVDTICAGCKWHFHLSALQYWNGCVQFKFRVAKKTQHCTGQNHRSVNHPACQIFIDFHHTSPNNCLKEPHKCDGVAKPEHGIWGCNAHLEHKDLEPRWSNIVPGNLIAIWGPIYLATYISYLDGIFTSIMQQMYELIKKPSCHKWLRCS